MNSVKQIMAWMIALCSILSFQSCIDREFDEPPACVEPGLTANTTIADLKALFNQNLVTITDSLIISGKVVADDESGNFYKQIAVEDATGGITVLIDGSSLFNSFPVGRTIFIKCKGLMLDDYNGLIQLGGSVDNSGVSPQLGGIPATLMDDYFAKGCDFTAPVPTIVSIGDLNNNHQSRLVTLENVEFDAASQGQPWADAVTQNTVNHNLVDCDGLSLIVRTSGYANFAADILPTGNGRITGIYSVYGADGQLFVRTLDDAIMNDTLCNEQVIIPGGDPVDSVSEDFESVTNNEDIDLQNWTNYYVTGGRKWQGKYFATDNNSYAQATAYSTGSAIPEMEAWLITPPLNMDVITTMTLLTATSFWVHDGLSVKYSPDYNGTNVESATWLPLSLTLAGSSSASNDWVASGNVDLTAYNGVGYIGFCYTGNSISLTSTFRLDDIDIH